MSVSGGIAGAFERAARAGRCAFIPFLTAGDPEPGLTVPLCESLARAGADIIELGVPFSDPVADGPTIQRSSERALARGVGLAACIELAGRARASAGVPIVLFSYYNPILRLGEEVFADRAAACRVDGVLVTDLPLEEGARLRRLLIERGIDPILLVAPTSGPGRIAQAAGQARGFLYYISRTGVTGAREALPEGLEEEVAVVRAAASLPVAVGFGVSSPAQVRAVSRIADGVVVGSALVSLMEEPEGESGAGGPGAAGRIEERIARLEAFAARLAESTGREPA